MSIFWKYKLCRNCLDNILASYTQNGIYVWYVWNAYAEYVYNMY